MVHLMFLLYCVGMLFILRDIQPFVMMLEIENILEVFKNFVFITEESM